MRAGCRIYFSYYIHGVRGLWEKGRHDEPGGGPYRVSTRQQLKGGEDVPIPAQQTAAHEYCRLNGHDIVREYFEAGVSAFSHSASERDIIEEVLTDAGNGGFLRYFAGFQTRPSFPAGGRISGHSSGTEKTAGDGMEKSSETSSSRRPAMRTN